MLTIRCTAKLLKRLRSPVADVPPVSTTKLGDWYANLIFARPAHLILCVSERTLLPVIIPTRDLRGMVDRLTTGLALVLRALGIPERCITEETGAMTPVTFARTANRSVLGTMNDFAYLLGHYLEDGPSLVDAALHLADTPCRVTTKEGLWPDQATRQLFGLTPKP